MKTCSLSGFTLTSTRKTVKSCLQTSNIRPTRPAGALRLRLRPPISGSRVASLVFRKRLVSKHAVLDAGRSIGLSFRSSPPWYTSVFASLAPKSVWRGVKTSSRFLGFSGHASSIVIPFCAIVFVELLRSILRSTRAPGMREGALPLS